MTPTWQTADGAARLWLADCRDVLPHWLDGVVEHAVRRIEAELNRSPLFEPPPRIVQHSLLEESP